MASPKHAEHIRDDAAKFDISTPGFAQRDGYQNSSSCS